MPCLQLVVKHLYLLWWSLIFKLWQWHVCLLESVLLLAGCCKRVLYHGEDPPIIHHFWFSWTSRLFYVAEFTSAFLLLRTFQTVDLANPNTPALSLMDLFHFWSLIIVCFTCMESSFDHMMRFTASASKWKRHTYSRSFTCLIDVEIK